MTENSKDVSVSGTIALLTAVGNTIILRNGFLFHGGWYWVLLLTVPLLVFSLVDLYKSRL